MNILCQHKVEVVINHSSTSETKDKKTVTKRNWEFISFFSRKLSGCTVLYPVHKEMVNFLSFLPLFLFLFLALSIFLSLPLSLSDTQIHTWMHTNTHSILVPFIWAFNIEILQGSCKNMPSTKTYWPHLGVLVSMMYKIQMFENMPADWYVYVGLNMCMCICAWVHIIICFIEISLTQNLDLHIVSLWILINFPNSIYSTIKVLNILLL